MDFHRPITASPHVGTIRKRCEKSSEGLSMEDLILAMGKHLMPAQASVAEDAAHHVACVEPSEADRHNCQHHSDRAASHSNGINGFGDSELRLNLSSMLASDAEEEIEFELHSQNHPRLNTPFYEGLRKKYPNAFRRRMSLGSETSSICGEFVTPRSEIAAPNSARRPRETRPPGSGVGLPPLPPGRAKKALSLPLPPDEDATVDSVGAEDYGIVGVPRRPPLSARSSIAGDNKGRLHGILKNGSQYSSTASLQSEAAFPSVRTLHRSDSTLSLRERLEKNQESWKQVLSNDTTPVPPARRRRDRGTNSSSKTAVAASKPAQQSAVPTVPLSRESVKTFDALQRRLHGDSRDFGLLKSGVGSSGSVPVDRVTSERSLSAQSNRRHKPGKRFASPDSSHDSAVDMDFTSVQSVPAADVPAGEIPMIPPPAEFRGGVSSHEKLPPNFPTKDGKPPLPVKPPRTRTPKLKSGRSSPLIMKAQLEKVGRAFSPVENDLVRPFSPTESEPFSPSSLQGSEKMVGMFVSGMREVDLPGFTYHNRDSDQDSGIAHGFPLVQGHGQGHGSLSSTDEDADGAIDTHSLSRYGPLGHQEMRLAQQRSRDGKRQDGPLKADHTIPAPTSPRQQHKRQFDEMENEAGPSLAARSHARFTSSDSNIAQAAERSRSADPSSRKRERVTFEDEVQTDRHFSELDRASSQPALNQGSLVPSSHCLRYQDNMSWHSQSDQDLYRQDYPALDGEPEPETETETETQRFRSMSATPVQQLLNAALCEQSPESISSSAAMEVHRASPVVAVNLNSCGKPPQPPKPKKGKNLQQKQKNLLAAKPSSNMAASSSSDVDSSSELTACSDQIRDVDFDCPPKAKTKSKLPWKRNKGRFTPSKEQDQLQTQMLTAGSRSSSLSSVASAASGGQKGNFSNNKPPVAAKPKYPAPNANARSAGDQVNADDDGYAEVQLPTKHRGDKDTAKEDGGYYEDISGIGDLTPRSMTESPYDTVASQEPSEPGSYTYTQVDFSKKTPSGTDLNPGVCLDYDDNISQIEAPPLPERGYKSDLERNSLSGSRLSLFDRMGSLKQSAKKKFGKLRRAISLDRMDKDRETSGSPEADVTPNQHSSSGSSMKKTPSLRSLTEALGIKKKSKSVRSTEEQENHSPSHRRPPRPGSAPVSRSKRRNSNSSIASVDTPKHFRPLGKILQLGQDGTRTIQLQKPPNGPFGFYIAKGNARYNHGIFVSRLSDSLPESFFAGLLSRGDEILEINGTPLHSLSLDDVYELMAQQDRLVFKTLPYTARGDNT